LDQVFDRILNKLEVLSSPYEELEGLREYMLPPKPEEHVLQTFCGT